MRLNRTLLIIIGIVVLVVLALSAWGVVSLVNNFESVTTSVTDWVDKSNDPIVCGDNATCSVVWAIVWTLIVTLAVLTGFAYTTLLERRILAWLQARVGAIALVRLVSYNP